MMTLSKLLFDQKLVPDDPGPWEADKPTEGNEEEANETALLDEDSVETTDRGNVDADRTHKFDTNDNEEEEANETALLDFSGDEGAVETTDRGNVEAAHTHQFHTNDNEEEEANETAPLDCSGEEDAVETTDHVNPNAKAGNANASDSIENNVQVTEGIHLDDVGAETNATDALESDEVEVHTGAVQTEANEEGEDNIGDRNETYVVGTDTLDTVENGEERDKTAPSDFSGENEDVVETADRGDPNGNTGNANTSDSIRTNAQVNEGIHLGDDGANNSFIDVLDSEKIMRFLNNVVGKLVANEKMVHSRRENELQKKFEVEKANYEKIIKNYENQCADDEEILNLLGNECNDKAVQYQGIKKKYQELDSENQALREEVELNKSELASHRANEDRLEEKNRKLEEKLEESKALMKAYFDQKQKMGEKVNLLENEIRLLQNQANQNQSDDENTIHPVQVKEEQEAN